MATVPLEFAPPEEEGIVALRVYEAASSIGPFVQIDRTEDVGTYPDYISSYTTTLASDTNDWFAFRWESEGDVLGDLSSPVQMAATNLVDAIADRVMQRDQTLNRAVVIQEAEAAIEGYFGKDPYTVTVVQPYRILRGLTNLVLAHSLLVRYIQTSTSDVEQVTIGLISMKSGSSSSTMTTREIEALLDMANESLGLNTSLVLQMAAICRRRLPVKIMEP